MNKGNIMLAYWQAVLKIFIKEHRQYLKDDIRKYNTLTEIDISDLDLAEVKSIFTLEKKINAKIGLLDILEQYHYATIQTIADNSVYYEGVIKNRCIDIALCEETITDLLKFYISKSHTLTNSNNEPRN